MEFDFDINNLFGQEITQLDKNLTPFRTSPANIREYKRQLCVVIDKLGVASAKAQGLHGPITSGSRMTLSDHTVYIMKKSEANNGRGAVVGFLKVGTKKLFVYDAQGNQHEIEPLCALDFYVHESMQRTGCGKKLFDFMVQAEGIKPQHIAIDRPSHKFLSFLGRHYGLKNSLPQRNNFVIFDSYFKSPPPNRGGSRRRPAAEAAKPPVHPYRRQQDVRAVYDRGDSRSSCRTPSRATNQSSIAQLQREAPPDTSPEISPEKDGPISSCHSSPGCRYRRRSPVSSTHSTPTHSPQRLRRENTVAGVLTWGDDQPTHTEASTVNEELADLLPAKLNVQAVLQTWPSPELQKEALSNVHLDTHNGMRPSSGQQGHKLPPVATDASHAASVGGQYSRHILNATPPGSCAPSPQHEPTRTQQQGGASPPSLRRDGPSLDYLKLLQNGHQGSRAKTAAYQEQPPAVNQRSPQQPRNPIVPASSPHIRNHGNRDLPAPDPYTAHSAKPKDTHTGWNIFGVPHSRSAPSVHPQPSHSPQKASAAEQYKKYRFYKQW